MLLLVVLVLVLLPVRTLSRFNSTPATTGGKATEVPLLVTTMVVGKAEKSGELKTAVVWGAQKGAAAVAEVGTLTMVERMPFGNITKTES
jgi:hypothetical protein